MSKDCIIEAKIHFGTTCQNRSNCQILILFVFWLPSWLIVKAILVNFWPKSKLCPVLWSHRSPLCLCLWQPCSWCPIPWNTLYVWYPTGAKNNLGSRHAICKEILVGQAPSVQPPHQRLSIWIRKVLNLKNVFVSVRTRVLWAPSLILKLLLPSEEAFWSYFKQILSFYTSGTSIVAFSNGSLIGTLCPLALRYGGN